MKMLKYALMMLVFGRSPAMAQRWSSVTNARDITDVLTRHIFARASQV